MALMNDMTCQQTATCTYLGLTQDSFNEKYDIPKREIKSWHQKINDVKQSCRSACQGKKVLRFIENRIPGISVIRKYKFREYMLGDIVSGLSVGIFTIPQGMGYALLASVPPILGLYTCLIPALIYFAFGNCPHSAMGTMGVSSLIIATAVEKGTRDVTDMMKNSDTENNTALIELLEQEQIAIAVTVTFFAGVVLIMMTVFQLGFIVSYMGDAFVSGYLTGANIRVLTHQVILCLGLKEYVSSHTGLLNYFFLVFDIFKNIKFANVATVIISVISLGIVLAVKYGVNDRYASKLKVPVPIEAIVVVIGIMISHFAKLDSRFGVKILKHVPQGMPSLTLPSSQHMQSYALEAVLLGVICFVFSGMMAKLFCGRHGYSVDNNQELLATGLCNTVGGLFSCIGVSVSPPRAFLMEMTGGHTQVAYVINALFILLVLFVIAPLLEALPVCILACLVITSCTPLFTHYIAFITYWKTSKYDFTIWVVTMVCTLGINVDTGLLVGFGFSFVVIVFQSQHPYTTSLAKHAEDGVYLDVKKTKASQQNDSVRIFKFDSPLYFATIDLFEEKLYKSTVSLSDLKKQSKLAAKKQDKQGKAGCQCGREIVNKDADNGSLGDKSEPFNETEFCSVNTKLTVANDTSHSCECHREASEKLVVKVIVVDCSCVAFGDTPGARLLAKLHTQYGECGVRFVLASCTERLQSLMVRVPECQALIEGDSLYPSLNDAVIACSQKV